MDRDIAQENFELKQKLAQLKIQVAKFERQRDAEAQRKLAERAEFDRTCCAVAAARRHMAQMQQ